MYFHSLFIIGLMCALVTVVGGIWWWISLKHISFSDTDIVTVQFSRGIIQAEIAVSPLKHAAGLSSRSLLAPNVGMLFIFSSPQKPIFWMKGMKFPLDFIWLRDNTVVFINENVPVPHHTFDFNIIKPNQPIDMVLEVNAGTVQKLEIQLGQKIVINKTDKF